MVRFLTKLSDQIVALISDEHSAKLAFQDDAKTSSPDFDLDSAGDFDRLFDFEVSQTGEQEETAVATEGFKVCPLLRFVGDLPNILKISHSCMSGINGLPPSCSEPFDMERLLPRVISGDMSQAIMSSEYIPGRSKRKAIGELRSLAFYDILKYVIPHTSHKITYRPLYQAIENSTLGVGLKSRPRQFGHSPTLRVEQEMRESLSTMADTKGTRRGAAEKTGK